MSKIVSVILLFILSTLVYAIDVKAPSYDKIRITPRTWQEVDLSYTDIIKGKSYPAEIKLLRPIEWLEENGMDKVGSEVNLSIPEFGVVNVHARVTAIKPTKLDTSKTDWSKIDSRPVIGTFKRYVPVVKTYTFRDLGTGEISTINATPNHPFYVKNKNKFIPIENVSPTDQLVNSRGQAIKLICNKGRSSHCGKLYNAGSKPIPVYNLEVYQQHVYYVGNANILIHNNCDTYARYEYSNNEISSQYFSIDHNHPSGVGLKNWNELYGLKTSPKSYGYNCLQCARRLDEVLETGNTNLNVNKPLSDISPAQLYPSSPHFTYNNGFDLDSGLMKSEAGTRFLIFAESVDSMPHAFNAIRTGNGIAYIEDFSSDGLDLIRGNSQIRIFGSDSATFRRMNTNYSGRWLSVQTGYVSNVPFI